MRPHGKGHEVEGHGRAAIKAPSPLSTTPAPTDNDPAYKKHTRENTISIPTDIDGLFLKLMPIGRPAKLAMLPASL